VRAAWLDYDQDGFLDAFFVNSGYTPLFHPPEPPQTALYRNNGDGTFTDVTAKAGLVNPDGKSLALVLADLNDDGWTDIFIANDTERNFVYFNRGDGTFQDASYTSGAGFSEEGKTEAGMSADAADLTGSSRMDLFVSHLDYELNRLYLSNGDATFTDATIPSGLGQTSILNSAFGARFFDFDNDGWRDLVVINGHILDNIQLYHPNVSYAEVKKLYRNAGHGGFVDATSTQNAAFLAPRVGRGLAVGDYDNDGALDLLVSNNGEQAPLFRNQQGTNPNHWLGIRLIGTKSNRDGIGARLKLVAGNLSSYDQAKGGMSYCSAQDPRIYFGLGRSRKVDSLEIFWPSGERQLLRDIPANQIITVEEGKGITAYRYPSLRRSK
jgi:hypothetical protein